MATTAAEGGAAEGSVPRYLTPAVERALGVIELLASRSEPLGVSVIARELEMPKSSCFNILATLQATGYIVRHDDQTWGLTLKVYFIGTRVGQSLDILGIARPVLERLAAETQLTTHLGLRDDSGVVYADKTEPPGFVKFETYPGKRASLHLTALGRAVAACLPEAERERLFAGYRFEGGTEAAATTKAEFERRLTETTVRGYAFENEEETPGVSCVAAPVFAHDGKVAAAIGVTGLSSQLSPGSVTEVADAVTASARSLTELLSE
jgi:DNA-binding IclR family transcriptional regulator